jgi:hypothetical protein
VVVGASGDGVGRAPTATCRRIRNTDVSRRCLCRTPWSASKVSGGHGLPEARRRPSEQSCSNSQGDYPQKRGTRLPLEVSGILRYIPWGRRSTQRHLWGSEWLRCGCSLVHASLYHFRSDFAYVFSQGWETKA